MDRHARSVTAPKPGRKLCEPAHSSAALRGIRPEMRPLPPETRLFWVICLKTDPARALNLVLATAHAGRRDSDWDQNEIYKFDIWGAVPRGDIGNRSTGAMDDGCNIIILGGRWHICLRCKH